MRAGVGYAHGELHVMSWLARAQDEGDVVEDAFRDVFPQLAVTPPKVRKPRKKKGGLASPSMIMEAWVAHFKAELEPDDPPQSWDKDYAFDTAYDYALEFIQAAEGNPAGKPTDEQVEMAHDVAYDLLKAVGIKSP